MRVKTIKFIFAAIMIVLSVMIAVSTYSNQQQRTVSTQASAVDWEVCNEDFSNAPCGICDVRTLTNGEIGFNCRLECGDSIEGCPNGPGTQNITAKVLTCNGNGEEICDSAQDDFIKEGIVAGSPWQLTRDDESSFTGTFPPIQCGRASIEIIMDAISEPAEGIYDTQVSCTLPTAGPSPSANPSGSPAPSPSGTTSGTPAVSVSPSVSLTRAPSTSPSPSPSEAITPLVTTKPTNTPTPLISATIAMTATPTVGPSVTTAFVTATPPPPTSGVEMPIFFIVIPFVFILLGLAL